MLGFGVVNWSVGFRVLRLGSGIGGWALCHMKEGGGGRHDKNAPRNAKHCKTHTRSFLTCRRVFLDMWARGFGMPDVILTDRRTTWEFDMSAHVFGTSVRVFDMSVRVFRMSAAPRLCHIVRSFFGMAAHSYWHVGASLLTCLCGFVGMSAGRLSHLSLSISPTSISLIPCEFQTCSSQKKTFFSVSAWRCLHVGSCLAGRRVCFGMSGHVFFAYLWHLS